MTMVEGWAVRIAPREIGGVTVKMTLPLMTGILTAGGGCGCMTVYAVLTVVLPAVLMTEAMIGVGVASLEGDMVAPGVMVGVALVAAEMNGMCFIMTTIS